MNIKNLFLRIFNTSLGIIKNQDTKYPHYIKKFEKRVSNYFNSKFCLTFSSGTLAARTLLVACGVKKGSKILMSKLSFPSVVTSALQIGANIEFLDFDNNLQIKNISKLKKPEVDYLLVTHVYGFPQNMDNISKFLENNKNIKLMEDCSHAQGAKFKNNYVGTFGVGSFMSMQGSKALSAGEGGLMLTNDVNIFEKSIVLSHINRKHNFSNKILENFSKVGLLGKGRAHPFGIISANLSLNNLNKNNKETRKKFEIIYNILKNIKNIAVPEILNFNELGGFHYGFPFFCEDINMLSKFKSKSKIIKYDWPCLDEYDEFSVGEKFNNLISDINFTKPLNNYTDERSKLYFIELNWIKKNSTKKISELLKNVN